jgi:hypothetical protein
VLGVSRSAAALGLEVRGRLVRELGRITVARWTASSVLPAPPAGEMSWRTRPIHAVVLELTATGWEIRN